MGMSMLQWLNTVSSPNTITKKQFGKIMHDPNATEEEKKRALRQVEETNGYENLPD